MYKTPELEIYFLSTEDILTSSPGTDDDLWNDGKGDNATEDDEL